MIKKLRIIILLTIGLMAGVSGYSQLRYDQLDQRLIEVYGVNRTQELLSSQASFMEYMNFYVSHAYQIVYNVPQRKLDLFDDISTVTNTRTGENLTHDNLDSINVLLLSITRKSDEYLTYKVGNTGTVIVFLSPDRIRADYEAWKKGEGKL